MVGIFIGGAAVVVFKMLFSVVVLLAGTTTGTFEVCFDEVMVATIGVVVVTAGGVVVVVRIGIVDVGLLTSFTGVELLPTLARVV